MTAPGRGRTRACRSAGVPSRGPRAASSKRHTAEAATPDWAAVELLLRMLAETRVFFRTANARSNWISRYEPGRRLRLETDGRSKWIHVHHLKGCWDTFERLGRIRRGDVLEPGRCSAFVMALFARVPGVREEHADGESLLLLDGADTGDG